MRVALETSTEAEPWGASPWFAGASITPALVPPHDRERRRTRRPRIGERQRTTQAALARLRESDAGYAALEWLLTPDENPANDALPSITIYEGYVVHCEGLGGIKPLSRRQFSLLACQLTSAAGVPLVERFKGRDKCSWWRLTGAQAIRAGQARESDWWAPENERENERRAA